MNIFLCSGEKFFHCLFITIYEIIIVVAMTKVEKTIVGFAMLYCELTFQDKMQTEHSLYTSMGFNADSGIEQ